ncbi:hypothetical protein PM082_016315 [Marasmius tenuissimus]|nr:hypothetical protein PM082_016315 [Marasmius tenuissimus]
MPFFYLTFFSFVVVAQALAPRGPTCTQQYIVQSGDSCNTIEENFELTFGTVRSLNSLVNRQCTNLYPGQWLCLATSYSGSSGSDSGGGGASCSQAYTVQSGDTCSKIEKNFGLSTGNVMKFNSAINPQCTNMYPGQSLCLVAGSSSGGSGGGGGSTVTVTVTSAGPVQTTTVLVTLTQTYTLSASIETGTLTQTTSTTTVPTSYQAACNRQIAPGLGRLDETTMAVPISVTATEASLVTTAATVTTAQSTTDTVTSTVTVPSANCLSVSQSVCAAKDKSGMDLYGNSAGFPSNTQGQCLSLVIENTNSSSSCIYKNADGNVSIYNNGRNCPAAVALVYASQ